MELLAIFDSRKTLFFFLRGYCLNYSFINTSSLICDCELKWFSHWLFLSNLDRKTVTMLCSYPIALRGIDIAVIDDANLTCGMV